jgi:hypothetical protein
LRVLGAKPKLLILNFGDPQRLTVAQTLRCEKLGECRPGEKLSVEESSMVFEHKTNNFEPRVIAT